MRSFFAAIIAAIVLAALSGVGLAWDGSYFLFSTLHLQSPFQTYGRLTHVPLDWLVLQFSHLSNSLIATQAAFGLVYFSLTLVALGASWWIVRDHAPILFVWSALAIGLGTLPGQVCTVCQANLDVQLFFPILLAILIGMPRSKVPLVGLIGLTIFFFHPVAIPLFALASAVAFVMSLRWPARRRALWLSALLLATAAAAAAVRFALTESSYEAQQLSIPVIQARFYEAVAGLPLAALVGAWFASLAVFLESFLSDRAENPKLENSVRVLGLGCILLSGELFFIWAALPVLWKDAVNFRTWVLFTSVPFAVIAVAEAAVRGSGILKPAARTWRFRRDVCRAVAVIFLVVLGTQSLVWIGLSRRLLADLNASPGTCVSSSAMTWMGGTPLQHWSITAYSLLIQGRAPGKLVMPGHDCTSVSFVEGLPVAIFGLGDWDLSSWQSGWFELRPLEGKLVAWQETPPSCRFPFTDGWFGEEEAGDDWWRWTSGHAAARLLLADASDATIRGEIVSLRQPNQVDIIVNGVKQVTIEIARDGFQPFVPLSITLPRGENSIEFVSHNPPATIPTDSRSLAVAVKNLAVALGDGSTICRYHTAP